jgi:hypothetical protein
MKNVVWTTMPHNAILVCYKSPTTGCQTFTHNKGQTLSQVFATAGKVAVTESITWASLSTAFEVTGTGTPGAHWCGLNLAFGTSTAATNTLL